MQSHAANQALLVHRARAIRAVRRWHRAAVAAGSRAAGLREGRCADFREVLRRLPQRGRPRRRIVARVVRRLAEGRQPGAVDRPGRADASLLIRALTGEVEPAMPPEDNARPTDARSPCCAPGSMPAPRDRMALKPNSRSSRRRRSRRPRSVRDVSHEPGRVARRQAACAWAVSPRRPGRSGNAASAGDDPELPGKVNSVAFSGDGACSSPRRAFPGCTAWPRSATRRTATIVSQIKGHRDALYDARLSPDGDLLATCSYDRQINLWDVATGKLVRTLPATTAPCSRWRFPPTAPSWPAPVPTAR